MIKNKQKEIVAEAVALAVREAATAAAKAVSDAAIASAAATSTTTTVDIGYIKTDIKEIKETLKEILNNTVTKSEYSAHLKDDADKEIRLRLVEQSMWKQVGMSSVIASLVAIGGAVAIKILFK